RAGLGKRKPVPKAPAAPATAWRNRRRDKARSLRGPRQDGMSVLCIFALPVRFGLLDAKCISSGAQTERRGDAGPVRVGLAADTHRPLSLSVVCCQYALCVDPAAVKEITDLLTLPHKA